MARYTGPNNKQARRVAFSVREDGTDLKRSYGPGQHGQDRKRKKVDIHTDSFIKPDRSDML